MYLFGLLALNIIYKVIQWQEAESKSFEFLLFKNRRRLLSNESFSPPCL